MTQYFDTLKEIGAFSKSSNCSMLLFYSLTVLRCNGFQLWTSWCKSSTLKFLIDFDNSKVLCIITLALTSQKYPCVLVYSGGGVNSCYLGLELGKTFCWWWDLCSAARECNVYVILVYHKAIGTMIKYACVHFVCLFSLCTFWIFNEKSLVFLWFCVCLILRNLDYNYNRVTIW